jgi:hypothetical protein
MIELQQVSLIASDSSSLTVEVIEHPPYETLDPEDLWLRCQLTAKSQGFAGRFECNMPPEDFSALQAALSFVIDNPGLSKTFEATEAFIELEIVQNSRGSFDAEVSLYPYPEGQVEFSFRLMGISDATMRDAVASLAKIGRH